MQAQFKINRSTESGQIETIENTFSKKTIDENNLDKGLKSNSLQFDIESGSNVDNDNRTSDINASVLVENMDDFKIDSTLQKEIDKVLDKSEMIQIVLNKLLSNDKSISSDLDVSVIQNMISKALSIRNINTDFAFIVVNTISKEIVLIPLLLDKRLNIPILAPISQTFFGLIVSKADKTIFFFSSNVCIICFDHHNLYIFLEVSSGSIFFSD